MGHTFIQTLCFSLRSRSPSKGTKTVQTKLSFYQHLTSKSSAKVRMNGNGPSMSGFRLTTESDPISREALQPTANYILSKIKVSPVLGMICGSGLGSLAGLVTDPVSLPYNTIPNFPVSTAPGHQGRLVIGKLSGVPVVIMQGRLHVYEGYPLWMCTLPVRIMKLLGVKMMIVSNAVGGLNPRYKVGDLMLV